MSDNFYDSLQTSQLEDENSSLPDLIPISDEEDDCNSLPDLIPPYEDCNFGCEYIDTQDAKITTIFNDHMYKYNDEDIEDREERYEEWKYYRRNTFISQTSPLFKVLEKDEEEEKELTKEEAKTKVYELTKQLAEIKKEKKSASIDFKDRINDVENEIEAIIDEQEAQNTPGTAP
jgi:hypothetical protein